MRAEDAAVLSAVYPTLNSHLRTIGRYDLAAIEVKATASLRPTDWKWLATLRDARNDRFKSAIVIYSGEQTIPLGDRLWAVPYSGLWA